MDSMLSPLANAGATRAVLEAHGLAAKHALGQNFLVNDDVLQKIVALAELSPVDTVLEVGPGIGTLTIALLKTAGKVVSVERDADLPPVLRATCAPWADRFALIQKDALALDPGEVREALAGMNGLARTPGASDSGPGAPSAENASGSSAAALPNKFVANLPYAVAATLVLDFFQRFEWLDSATVMVQKEVADRIAAEPGTKNYGAYTVKLRLYAQVAGRFSVGPGNFFPPPRVDSAVVRLNRRALAGSDGCPLGSQELADACTMADAAFATRRKTLANSCKTYFAGRGGKDGVLIASLPQLFERAGIDARRRGETLSLEEFLALGAAYRSLQA